MTTSTPTGPAAPEDWWRRAVVYQVYPRSFADADGDGVGDLRGVIDHLDHLADLGVDVLWLSPVYASPQDDNGYDISDYQSVDPMFGTMADLDDLVTGLHARGMRLVMDLVVNHTSDEHPWFVASRSSRDDPQRDWYWWRPPRAGMAAGTPGAEPTTWTSAFSGPAWEFDPATGEYYLHLFSRKQPDLNWENPQVRQAIYAMMRWWVDRGVDGFRMDVINFISKAVRADGSLPDGIGGTGGTEHYVCGPRIHEFLAEMHAEVFAGRSGDQHLLTVGEMPGVTVADAARFTDPASAELDMVFQFEHVGIDQGTSKWDRRPFDLLALKASFGRWQAALADRGWNSLYWNNHDQPRIVSRWGDDSPAHRRNSATCLATLLHLHRGTPYVYQGEEIGMANVRFTDVAQLRDIEALRHLREQVWLGHDEAEVLAGMAWVARDNARTPMQWDARPGAGFTTGTPWIDVNPDHEAWNVAAQRDDPHSVLAYYRTLIALRHTDDVVAVGDFTMLAADHEQLYAFTRSRAGRTLLVVCNVSSTPLDLTPLAGELPGELADVLAADVVLSNLPASNSAGSPVGAAPGPVMSAWEARVLEIRTR